MDNINREVRNRTEIDNNILWMDIEPQANEYKNVKGTKVENDSSIKGLVQRNIQEQKREYKIINSVDRQAELPQIADKRTISVSNGIRQSEDMSVEDKVMGRYNDSKQNSNQRTEMVNKENRGQLTRVIEQQNNNMHVNNRSIRIELWSDTDRRQTY
ncbi:MAG: hypothetical protein EZS28_039532, partial [Streblomastix strix]